MENPTWNLLVKAASLIAAILLMLGTGLVFAAHFAITQNKTAGLVSLFFATVMAVFGLFASTLSNNQMKREMGRAADAAHKLSQGELYGGNGSSDLTVQAEVGPKITGAIADAFNSMTHNLRSLTLVELSGRLRSSVSPFKLPPDMSAAKPPSPETSIFVN